MEEYSIKQTLTLTDCKELMLNGVNCVLSFDPEYVCLETNKGKLSVEGKSLIIDSLSKENGEIFIRGEINGIFYSMMKNKEKHFFSGLFK